jgi:hypothetical protein
MITFEKQNNIEVAAIDANNLIDLESCSFCIFKIHSDECHNAECTPMKREDNRNVFFLSINDKRILDYKIK